MASSSKIFITGGSGFIGSKLVEKLISIGIKPYLLVRKDSDVSRITPFLKFINLIEGDLLIDRDVKNIIGKIKPNIIFHLASHGVYSYTNLSEDNTKIILETNFLATLNLLHSAEKNGCEIFVNTGTCFEYGDSNLPFNENNQLNPCNIYGASKVMSSLICNILSKSFQMKIITLRPFTVYGPGQDNRRFIATTIDNCFKGTNLKLTKQEIIRDYIFIDDVVNAYIVAAKKGKKFSGEAFNISTGKGTALHDVANTIMELLKVKKIKIQDGMFPQRKGEVYSLIGNPVKANKFLDWKAEFSLNEGLLSTIEWYKQNLFK